MEQPEAGRGRREQASVQHCIQLVGQVVKHVADVFQDVLGRVHSPRVAGEERERVKALLKGCSYLWGRFGQARSDPAAGAQHRGGLEHV